jgi:predicted ATP-grasp superfamily ATP-dependent carboligase
MDRTFLIVAASGRALAASARRGGLVPLVADYFGDQDTLASAQAHRRIAAGLANGMEPDAVLAALAALADGAEPEGIVCGTGFEDRPDLLATIGQRWRIVGNTAEVVRQVKHPVQWAALCRMCGLSHPQVTLDRPADGAGWLMKRQGGAGGSHIREDVSADRRPGSYYQRRVAGTAVSALFLADGRRTTPVGFSTQWSSPAPYQPFRYGGAVTAAISPRTAQALNDAIRRVMRAVPLAGLNSADFLIDGDRIWLLEINPRPGATLDLFEPDGASLFAMHVEACRGRLPPHVPLPAGARAAAIVYAEQDIPVVPAFDWPDWTADRPQPGSAVKAGEPLCTVTAVAASAEEARRMVEERGVAVLPLLYARAA